MAKPLAYWIDRPKEAWAQRGVCLRSNRRWQGVVVSVIHPSQQSGIPGFPWACRPLPSPRPSLRLNLDAVRSVRTVRKAPSALQPFAHRLRRRRSQGGRSGCRPRRAQGCPATGLRLLAKHPRASKGHPCAPAASFPPLRPGVWGNPSRAEDPVGEKGKPPLLRLWRSAYGLNRRPAGEKRAPQKIGPSACPIGKPNCQRVPDATLAIRRSHPVRGRTQSAASFLCVPSPMASGSVLTFRLKVFSMTIGKIIFSIFQKFFSILLSIISII